MRRDFFGTHTESILIETAHRNLRIDSRSRVSVSRKALDRAAPSPSWDDIRDVAFEATSLGPASPVGYVFASALVPVQAPVTAYAAASFPPGGGILAGAADLMRRIRNDFKYDPKATVISTPLKEVFEKRHGVCQDFAHVMIAGLRGLGLPAAYVSGYLRTIPPPGQAAPAGRRRHPRLGVGVVRRRARLGRVRSDQRPHDRERPHHSGGRAATSPMSRRSTASSSARASRSSAWPWTCCRWSNPAPPPARFTRVCAALWAVCRRPDSKSRKQPHAK